MASSRHPVFLTVLTVLLTPLVVGVPAGSAVADPGDRPIAAYLELDRGFDRRPGDFDVAERTIAHVLSARPDSRLDIVDRGQRRATGFLPTDRAFRRFARVLDDDRDVASEREVFDVVRGLGVDLLERAMLLHVVIGRTLDTSRLRDLRGSRLRTAEGQTIRVRIRDGAITLTDADPDSPDPQVVRADVNAGNRHVAHGVDRVLRFLDLPR